MKDFREGVNFPCIGGGVDFDGKKRKEWLMVDPRFFWSENRSFTSQNSLGWVCKAVENPGGRSRRGMVRARLWPQPQIQFIPKFLDVEGKSQGIRQGIANSSQAVQFFGMEVLGFVGCSRSGWLISTCGSCAGIGNSQG